MAESGAGVDGNSIGTLLEHFSNIGNLFLAFVIAGLVPAVKYFGKRYSNWKEKKEEKTLEEDKAAIVDIAKEAQQPLSERMEKVEDLLYRFTQQNETILDHITSIENLLQSARISFSRGPGRPSKHFDHSSGLGDKSD